MATAVSIPTECCPKMSIVPGEAETEPGPARHAVAGRSTAEELMMVSKEH